MQKERSCAPVLIPTLCRAEHLKRCMESLRLNPLAKDTPVYIALDYPLKESHWEGYNAISEFLAGLSGFASITVIRRSENYGAAKNTNEAREMLFKKYDRLIFSEDDNEFAPNFLEYINEGLERFEAQKEVFAICGYKYPIDMPDDYKANHFYAKLFGAWGYGIWRDRYYQYQMNKNIDYVKSVLRHFKNIRKLSSHAEMLILHSLNMVRHDHVTGDTIICLKLITENLCCVLPAISKVRNHGYDGSGIHCNVDKRYSAQAIDDKKTFKYDETVVQENSRINLLIKRAVALPFRVKVKVLILYLFYKINLIKLVKHL